ncbi:hypothetical protein WDU94_002373, partial [Cyamophila willieti]
TRGGNKKYRALRIDQGNFSWGSECCTRKTRIIDVVYNASNNELVQTQKTLVKNAIVVIDATPFRQWYETYYALPIGRRKTGKLVSKSFSVQRTCEEKHPPQPYTFLSEHVSTSPQKASPDIFVIGKHVGFFFNTVKVLFFLHFRHDEDVSKCFVA